MSDSLVFCNTVLSKSFIKDGGSELPRYYDMVSRYKQETEQQETAEQVYSRFDNLRRKSE